MCGRYINTRTGEEIAAEFDVDRVTGDELAPSWNIAPTQPARIVLDRTPHGETSVVRELRTARWGLIPSWAADTRGAARRINARVETVTDKPSYRAAAVRRRCLIPADGYYEWTVGADGKRTPHLLHLAGEHLAFAGLYEWWQNRALSEDHPDRWVCSFTIITTTAPNALAHVHERTPVIVPEPLRGDWLDRSLTRAADVQLLLASMPLPALLPVVVGPEVGNARNDGPHLALPRRDDWQLS